MPTSPLNVAESLGPMLPPPVRKLLKPLEPAVCRWIVPDALLERAEAAGLHDPGRRFPRRLLELLDIRYDVAPSQLARIPRSGPVVVVANHPFGLLEGLVLADMLGGVRADLRILANSLLAGIGGMHEYLIPVNPFGGNAAARENVVPLRSALTWLRAGGLLASFPAGEVARMNWKEHAIQDVCWNTAAARMAKRTRCPVVPVFFEGANSLGFHFAGALHPRLGTISLVRELNNKRGQGVVLRVGSPIPASLLERLGDEREATEYLRRCTYLMGAGATARQRTETRKARPCAAVVHAAPGDLMQQEVESLEPLAASGELAVYLAPASRIPATLGEIGRLRELTFRAVGEGTGAATDLDRYDRHYVHLFLWNRERREIAGGYRLGPTAEILRTHGVTGLYTHSLFRLDARLFQELGPAIELGRSFVAPEYQRQYAPLLLLWKGILAYVAAHPECYALFGPVSISNDYTQVSRDLIVGFLDANRDQRLARFVHPRRRYKPDPRSACHCKAMARFLRDIEQLSAPLSTLEPDGKGVPVLIKQYAKLGARALGFNVDPAFSWVVDALVVVDLRRSPRAVLDRYMGAAAGARFREFHSLG